MGLEGLAFHDRSTMCWMVVPDPVAVSTAELELLATNEMLADTAPLVVGVNVTLKGALWPAARLSGSESPAIVNAALFEVAEVRVRLPPLAVTVPFCVCELPIVTFPKFMEAGATLMVPLEPLPVPVRDTFTVGSEASEVS